jgi:hypothetical protein
MPAKFKESERVYRKDARGRRMSTDSQKCKMYKHYYLKQETNQTLLDAINSDRTKPKHKQKFRNELVRRGVKLVYEMPDGTQIPRTLEALQDFYSANPQLLKERIN